MFYKIKNPPQWLLDGLLTEEITTYGKCPDCGVNSGEIHHENCDVARCLNTGTQRLMCDCDNCGEDVWTGIWPGVMEAYEKKLMVFDTATSSIMFDLNSVLGNKQ